MRAKLPLVSLGAALIMMSALPGLQFGNSAAPCQSAEAAATSPQLIQTWFSNYDKIRRQAQMNPADRARADNMMSKGLSIIIPGAEKVQAQAFLQKLVDKNTAAANSLKHLQLYPETEKLHRGYYRYFTDAAGIFRDYINVQNNLFAVDGNGKAIAGGLPARKASLEQLDAANKQLDAQLREQFGIAPYQY